MMVTLCCSGDGSPEEEEEEDLGGLGPLGLEKGRGWEVIVEVSAMASAMTP